MHMCIHIYTHTHTETVKKDLGNTITYYPYTGARGYCFVLSGHVGRGEKLHLGSFW